MGDLRVEVTPSAELLAAAKQEAEVIDARARVIKLRKPGVLAQYRLVETLGESASNQVYMGMVLPLIYVASIDGAPVSARNKMQIEALIQQLDEDGIKAVMEGVTEHFGNPDPEADKAALKS
jgi:hypothetical protein